MIIKILIPPKPEQIEEMDVFGTECGSSRPLSNTTRTPCVLPDPGDLYWVNIEATVSSFKRKPTVLPYTKAWLRTCGDTGDAGSCGQTGGADTFPDPRPSTSTPPRLPASSSWSTGKIVIVAAGGGAVVLMAAGGVWTALAYDRRQRKKRISMGLLIPDAETIEDLRR